MEKDKSQKLVHHPAIQKETILGMDQLQKQLKGKTTNHILSKQQHWFFRIFPSSADTERAKFEAKLVQLEADAEYDYREMQKKALKEMLKESLNTILENGKGKMRKERFEVFMLQSLDLQREFDDMTDMFMDYINPRLDKLPFIKHETLRMLEEKRLTRATEHFFQSVETLKTRFHNIIHEGVNQSPRLS